MRIKNKKVIILVTLVIAINIIIDQITKYYAKVNLKSEDTIEVVGDLFILKYTENNGAFLSLGSNLSEPLKTLTLIAIPTIVIIISIIYIFFNSNLNSNLNKIEVICISSIIGGGVSNIYDRIFNNGFVIDFLNFGIGNFRTGILNTADISITFGAIIFIIILYIKDKKNMEKNMA